ncbi:MAG TPA: NADH-quinone oxidoreductase subunit J [Streptosporangiaceae bacterium]|jgi:NADH-quinone oxidoreductase subunit J|nr:NADH-quinone oxidoreductase subunit J [Streptosporangiaceae bacterium]
MFWVIAVVSVPAALGMIFARKAVYCALLLAVVMLSLATAYAVLEAPFLAFVQVIVYTGAVLMLFLFVIMLVGVSSTDSLVETIRGQRLWAGIAGLGFIVLLILGLGQATLPAARGLAGANRDGNVQGLAALVFTKYVFAFEVTSALLITAALGAMVLAHRERTSPKPTQKELSRRRFESGRHPAPLPGPGTYARHNAVDMPALLPDGSVSELSVNPVIGGRPELNRSLHTDLEGETERDAVADDVAAVRAATVRGEAEPRPGTDARSGGPSGAKEDGRK